MTLIIDKDWRLLYLGNPELERIAQPEGLDWSLEVTHEPLLPIGSPLWPLGVMHLVSHGALSAGAADPDRRRRIAHPALARYQAF